LLRIHRTARISGARLCDLDREKKSARRSENDFAVFIELIFAGSRRTIFVSSVTSSNEAVLHHDKASTGKTRRATNTKRFGSSVE
jgi:hypothetical protein